jgi:hypothetical protein
MISRLHTDLMFRDVRDPAIVQTPIETNLVTQTVPERLSLAWSPRKASILMLPFFAVSDV